MSRRKIHEIWGFSQIVMGIPGQRVPTPSPIYPNKIHCPLSSDRNPSGNPGARRMDQGQNLRLRIIEVNRGHGSRGRQGGSAAAKPFDRNVYKVEITKAFVKRSILG